MNLRILAIGLLLAGPFSSAHAASPLDVSQLVQALRDGNRGDDGASLQAARIQLAQGNPAAALTRLAQTARRGHVPARAVLVDALAAHQFATMKPAEAQAFVDEYRAASAHGDHFGSLMLGLFAEYGFGSVTQDFAAARAYFEAAARDGSIWALTRLGLMFEQGRAPTIAADLSMAAYWYDQASGVDAEATAHIVAMYRSGKPWTGHEPRTSADLAALEAHQHAWNAAHAVGP